MYKKEIEILKKKERFRQRKIYDENITDLASNDYLGLAEKKEILQKAYTHALHYRSHGAKASILVNGYHPSHMLLEEKIKKLHGFEDALIIGSGYMANLALFELGRRGDLFLVDSEYHASGITGSSLTQANVIFFKHNCLEDLKNKAENHKKYKRVFTVVEGIYSMKGDMVKKEITDFAQEIGHLIIDEAHSVGCVGENLMGVSELYALDRKKTVKMGTLGKALGSYGAYITATEEIITYLTNRAKSVIYTTALSVMDTLTAYYAFEEIENSLSEYRKKIEEKKLIFNSDSLIKIIPAKNSRILLKKQKELLQKGILVGAIRPPTVNSPIFRVILRTNIDNDTIKTAINYLEEKC